MRPERHRRLVVRCAIVLAIGAGGLALALGLGLPDPGASERAFAGLAGALGVMVAWSWLRLAGTDSSSPLSEGAGRTAPAEALSPLAPSVESAAVLEREISFGVTTMASFQQMVRPRLRALAIAKLARAGCSLEDEEAARRFLGEDWQLVGPRRPQYIDAVAPGVPLSEVERLVDTLEGLP